MKANIQKLQDAISPEAIGIIWITKELLCSTPKPFYSLDYFLDGQLSQYNSRNKDNKHIRTAFFTKNFDHKFFVFHSTDKNIDEVFNLAKNKEKINNKIIIVDEKDTLNIEKLSSQYKEYSFDKISIE